MRICETNRIDLDRKQALMWLNSNRLRSGIGGKPIRFVSVRNAHAHSHLPYGPRGQHEAVSHLPKALGLERNWGWH